MLNFLLKNTDQNLFYQLKELEVIVALFFVLISHMQDFEFWFIFGDDWFSELTVTKAIREKKYIALAAEKWIQNNSLD